MPERKNQMRRSTRGLLTLLALLPVMVLVFALLYMLGETYLEYRPRTFLASVEWAAETLTTTGYGADASWNHPLMVTLVVLTQFSGLFLVFLIFPIYVLPYFEERFEARLSHTLPKIKDFILILHFSPAVSTLVEELKRLGRQFVVLEQDRSEARSSQDRDLPVVQMSLIETSLDTEELERISAVVANDTDQDNAALIMMLREQGYDGPILAFSATPLHRLPMQHLGATAVFTPKHLLSAALATRASRWITARVRDVQELGDSVGVYKLRVHRDSPLAGLTLKQSGLRQRGVSVVGMWSGGLFIDLPAPETVISAGSVMVTIGSHAALTELSESEQARPLTRSGPFLICGYGEVGQKVAEMLRDAGEPVFIVNDREVADVEIVGNVMDSEVLQAMAALEPRAIILTIGNDTETQFVSAVVRDFLPDVPLIARVNQAQSVDRLHRLGVDFALSVDSVAGELLAAHLLGEEFVEVDPELRISRTMASGLEGDHPWRVDLLGRFGCKVVAVARAGEVLINFEDDFSIQAEDEIFLCGSPQAINNYLQAFPQARLQQPLEPARLSPAL